jgi:hypothetical protein
VQPVFFLLQIEEECQLLEGRSVTKEQVQQRDSEKEKKMPAQTEQQALTMP